MEEDDLTSPLDEIVFDDAEIVSIKDLTALYEAVEWTAYSDDPDALARAVDRSDYVVTARNAEGELVGLIRCQTDEVHLLFIQDVVVTPAHQRRGIGSVLVGRCLTTFAHVRQKVLLTDPDDDLRAFYAGFGFTSPELNGVISLTRFDD